MAPKVAAVTFEEDYAGALRQALDLIGGISDLNTAKRNVVIKVGIFDHKEDFHSSPKLVDVIAGSFSKAPKVFVAESDNYKGTGTERLQNFNEVFNDRVVPFNLSQDTDVRQVKVADETIGLSHILFRPNVLVSTHVLRSTGMGSVLKNLLGLIPDRKKVRFHRKLGAAVADVYEAVGGIDLAVIDGTHLWQGLGPGRARTRMNTLLVGRDAVAVETVGAMLAGVKPQKMPIVQEFTKRSLGEGDLENIHLVGADFESLKQRFEEAAKILKKSRRRSEGAQTWGGQAHRAFKKLIHEGFFKLPSRRTMKDVAKALEAKGLPIENKEDNITNLLNRRVRNGTLTVARTQNGQVYWTE